MSRSSTIAIDGPGAVGKSAVGNLLAKKLGYRFLDTGAMYRALTWLALKKHVNLEDEEALGELAATTEIDLPGSETALVLVDGQDVTREIRHPDVEAGVSLVAKAAGVRQALVVKQQRMARGGQVVMAGRDIGTVVLPDADLKIYLIASPEERARRRFLELQERGERATYANILADLKRRDRIDSERSLSPLQPADDARVVNTDGLDLEQVVAIIYDLVGDV